MCSLSCLFIYIFVYFGMNFRTCGFASHTPCSRHLDKMFSSKDNFEFDHNGVPSYFLYFSPRHTLRFTMTIVSRLALSSQVQSLSHLSLSFPQIDSIAQVLLSCANITKIHHIKGVKSSQCFQSHISHKDCAS
jgi:hypothetical protein